MLDVRRVREDPELFRTALGRRGLAEKVDEIFEPFYMTKLTGMGMGLSIARTIVEAHEGQISAENLAGQGALFRIRLPLVRSSALAAS